MLHQTVKLKLLIKATLNLNEQDPIFRINSISVGTAQIKPVFSPGPYIIYHML